MITTIFWVFIVVFTIFVSLLAGLLLTYPDPGGIFGAIGIILMWVIIVVTLILIMPI